jgi:hypothetical protein
VREGKIQRCVYGLSSVYGIRERERNKARGLHYWWYMHADAAAEGEKEGPK